MNVFGYLLQEYHCNSESAYSQDRTVFTIAILITECLVFVWKGPQIVMSFTFAAAAGSDLFVINRREAVLRWAVTATVVKYTENQILFSKLWIL